MPAADGAGARGRCSKRHGTVLRKARERRAVEQGDEADEARGGTGQTDCSAATCVPPLRGGTHRFAAYPRCSTDFPEGPRNGTGPALRGRTNSRCLARPASSGLAWPALQQRGRVAAALSSSSRRTGVAAWLETASLFSEAPSGTRARCSSQAVERRSSATLCCYADGGSTKR